eukprot:1025142-Alexandrium_andersonii.AAC.1
MTAIRSCAARSLGEASGCAGGGERDAGSAPPGPGLRLPREGERAAGERNPPGLGAAGGAAGGRSPPGLGAAGGLATPGASESN